LIKESVDFLVKKNKIKNESHKVSRWNSLCRYGTLLICGVLLILAFPSFNYYLLAWVGLLPLYFLVRNLKWYKAWLGGFVWGYGWSVALCWWLGEIEFFIPLGISFVLACFFAFWAVTVPIMRRYMFVPVKVQLEGYETEQKYYKSHNFYLAEIFSALFLASWWCVIEWTRSWLFTGLPWNLMAVSQWNQYPLIQICSYTGIYGVSFLIVFFNIAIGDAIYRYYLAFKYVNNRKKFPVSFYISVALIALTFIFGVKQINEYQSKSKLRNIIYKAGVVEGNIPQCRVYNAENALNALNVYSSFSNDILKFKPDILIWPESAVPQPLRGSGYLSRKYRTALADLIKEYKIPILLGTMDFGFGETRENGELPIYNSAILIDSVGKVKDKYNKMHLVPWGEYTPFEYTFPFKYFYPWIKSTFGMGRSLAQGTENKVFNLNKDVRASVLICYEDIFPGVARGHVLAGANMLILITNDAWYPTSDEPEQHLAQAVFRAVENSRIMIRVGNSAGTCVVLPTGIITNSLFYNFDDKIKEMVPDPTQRGSGTAVFKVNIQENPELTFYTKYGNIFILICGIISCLSFIWVFFRWIEKKKKLLDIISKQ